MLVGLTISDYHHINLTDEEVEYKTWVFLDHNIIQWSNVDDCRKDKNYKDKLLSWT
jgi:hypothetical protein